MMSKFNGSSFSMKTYTSFLECNFFARFVIRGWSFFPATILPCNFFFLSMFACLGPGPQFSLWGFYSNFFGWPIFAKFWPHSFFCGKFPVFFKETNHQMFYAKKKKVRKFCHISTQFFFELSSPHTCCQLVSVKHFLVWSLMMLQNGLRKFKAIISTFYIMSCQIIWVGIKL
jgi:hypothetical protein